MKKRIVNIIMLAMFSASTIMGCSNKVSEIKEVKAATMDTAEESSKTSKGEYTSYSAGGASTTEGVNVDLKGEYSNKALESDFDEDEAEAVITLKGSSIEINGDGAKADGSTLTISEKGTYILRGTLEDGCIIIDNENEENIRLVLDGADITSTDSCAIYAKNAKNVYITLAEGTENNISDKRALIEEDEEESDTTAENAGSAIYSEADLIINGSGTLNLTSNNDGIKTKDDLVLISGIINITAGDDGMIGKDSVQIRDGNITIECADDCIKASKDDDPEKGYAVIDGGNITLSSKEGHGVQAVYVFVMNDGSLTVTSCKEGIESLNIVQNGGSIDITASDDGVNVSDKRAEAESESSENNESAGNMPEGGPDGNMGAGPQKGQMGPGRDTVSGQAGKGGIAGGGKMPGMKGERGGRQKGSQTVSGGNMPGGRQQMQQEGNMGGPGGQMQGGQMQGENMQGGMGGGPGGDMQGGMGGTFENIDGCIVINGGEMTIDAGGDGLDSNGDILIKGGTVRVYGPTGNGNGAVDKNGVWEQDGGTVYIQGSSGMLESVDGENSEEGFVSVIFDQNVDEGEEISLIDEDGNTVMSFTSKKSVPFVFFADEDIENGKEYTVKAGSQSQTVTAGQMSGGGFKGGAPRGKV